MLAKFFEGHLRQASSVIMKINGLLFHRRSKVAQKYSHQLSGNSQPHRKYHWDPGRNPSGITPGWDSNPTGIFGRDFFDPSGIPPGIPV
jgi:hypothetical protein